MSTRQRIRKTFLAVLMSLAFSAVGVSRFAAGAADDPEAEKKMEEGKSKKKAEVKSKAKAKTKGEMEEERKIEEKKTESK